MRQPSAILAGRGRSTSVGPAKGFIGLLWARQIDQARDKKRDSSDPVPAYGGRLAVGLLGGCGKVPEAVFEKSVAAAKATVLAEEKPLNSGAWWLGPHLLPPFPLSERWKCLWIGSCNDFCLPGYLYSHCGSLDPVCECILP